MNFYSSIKPIDARIRADRQGAKRHYGVHPYFTRRPYNVVRQYLRHYSCEGDRVLDPFGGSGVTAIEAFLENRVGLQNDINPLANFIAKGITELTKGDIAAYREALEEIRLRCERQVRGLDAMSDGAIEKMLRQMPLPPNPFLPASSDVANYHDLFSRRQLAALVLLREAVNAIPNRHAQNGMRLAWSATLAKLNSTFLSAEGRAESRGGSSIFSIYRYKVAADPVELPPWPTFYERAQNILVAKTEIDKIIKYRNETGGFHGRFEVHDFDVDELPDRIGPVDYIFTDPPYGGHISYIDLSTLWNVWNGTTPRLKDRQRELIVGGELRLAEDVYVKRLHGSIATCLKLLKSGRWLSVVFQHWSTAYFNALLTGAASAGGDLRAAISQVGDPIWSMHKKKGNHSVLAGEMILTFLKTGKPKTVELNKSFDLAASVAQILQDAPTDTMYGEYLFNRIIIDAWEEGALGSLDVSRESFSDLLRQHGWSYDEEAHKWRRRGAPRIERLFEHPVV